MPSAFRYREETRSTFSVWDFDIILPVQYYGLIQRGSRCSPHMRLMFAILESALHDIQRYCRATGVRGRRLFRETLEWFTEEDVGTVSFVFVCDVLEMDPAYIRKGLSAWLAAHTEPARQADRLVLRRSVVTVRRIS